MSYWCMYMVVQSCLPPAMAAAATGPAAADTSAIAVSPTSPNSLSDSPSFFDAKVFILRTAASMTAHRQQTSLGTAAVTSICKPHGRLLHWCCANLASQLCVHSKDSCICIAKQMLCYQVHVEDGTAGKVPERMLRNGAFRH